MVMAPWTSYLISWRGDDEMVFTFTDAPPRKTVAQMNAIFQDIADNLNLITSTGVGAGGYDFMIRKSGAVYEAYNSQATLAYGGSGDAGGADGDDFADVINHAIDDGNGKHIKLGAGTFSYTDKIYINSGELAVYAENMQNVWIEGSGEYATILEFTGASDYAIHWRGRFDGVSDSVKLSDFTLTGSSLTADRCGIKLDRGGGELSVIRDVQILEMDIALALIDTDSNLLDHVKIETCNTGIFGHQTGLSTQSKVAIHDYSIFDAATYAIHLEQGRYVDIGPGCIATSATGIFVDNDFKSINIHGLQTESNTDNDIYIQGPSITYPVKSVTIQNCNFKSVGAGAGMKAVNLKWCDVITIDNCRWDNIPTAIYYAGSIQQCDLLIRQPDLETVTTFIDVDDYAAGGLTRFGGTVQTAKATGLITMAAGGTLSAGDLVSFCHTYANLSYGVGTIAPAVVLFGGAQNHPCVVAISGIVPVAVDDAVSEGDILVPSDTNGQACSAVDSTDVDTNKIVGTAMTATVGAGTAYVRVGV